MNAGHGLFSLGQSNSVAPAPDASPMTERIEGVRTATLPAPVAAPGTASLTSASRSTPSPFEQLARRLGREITRGEALVGTAASGRYEGLDAGRLIALQAGIYRYSEAIDLTVKLVDRATNGVRTILESGR